MQMGEAEDMAKRLEGFIVETEHYGRGLTMAIDVSDVEEAAALIRAQEAEIAELRGALRPFAGDVPTARPNRETWRFPFVGLGCVTNEQIRRARAALGGNNDR
jgi:hypothetical protein